jgi:FKBP-type peptidyl-prolyl cis-trans isomerase FklB
MKKAFISLVLLALAVPAFSEDQIATLKDQKQTNSYSIGMSLGNIWKVQELDVDLDAMRKGITDAMGGGKTLLTETEARAALNQMQQEVRTKLEAKRKVQGEKNKIEGEAFLKENATKSGVVTLPSGLQYKILTEGTGAKPTSNDTVTVNYRGKLVDGTEFDSSFSRNQPATFALNRVIKGWTEGIQQMKTGSKCELYLPSNLAYGENGSGMKIAPNATLIFEVELLAIKPAAAPANQPVTSDIIKVPSSDEMKKGAQIEVIKKDDPRLKETEKDKAK